MGSLNNLSKTLGVDLYERHVSLCETFGVKSLDKNRHARNQLKYARAFRKFRVDGDDEFNLVIGLISNGVAQARFVDQAESPSKPTG